LRKIAIRPRDQLETALCRNIGAELTPRERGLADPGRARQVQRLAGPAGDLLDALHQRVERRIAGLDARLEEVNALAVLGLERRRELVVTREVEVDDGVPAKRRSA